MKQRFVLTFMQGLNLLWLALSVFVAPIRVLFKRKAFTVVAGMCLPALLLAGCLDSVQLDAEYMGTKGHYEREGKDVKVSAKIPSPLAPSTDSEQ